MNKSLKFGELLDLEFFLEQDRAVEPAVLMDRDRQLGLEAAASGIERSEWLKHWLAARRRVFTAALPSQLLRQAKAVLRGVASIFGLCLGAGLCRGLLTYTGVEPVNISLFLVVAVLPQILLVFLGAAAFAGSGIPTLVGLVPLWRVIAFGFKRLTGTQSAPGAELLRIMFQGHGPYRTMFFWECLRIVQLAGVFFVLGMLGMFLGSILTLDLAFGWQSTLQVGASGMARFVAVLATPWSWLTGLAAVPDYAQIEGSRIVLKDGISTLSSSDLTAWWPFLAMTLCCYALIPRMFLLVAAGIRLKKLEHTFVHPAIGILRDRMSAPRIVAEQPQEAPREALPIRAEQMVESPVVEGACGCVLILSEELQGRIAPEGFRDVALRLCGYGLSATIWVDLEGGLDPHIAANFQWQGGMERYLLVLEAWQPPIREIVQHLHDFIRARARARVMVVLLGRPAGGEWLTTPVAGDVRIWTEALRRISPDIVVHPMEQA